MLLQISMGGDQIQVIFSLFLHHLDQMIINGIIVDSSLCLTNQAFPYYH